MCGACCGDQKGETNGLGVARTHLKHSLVEGKEDEESACITQHFA